MHDTINGAATLPQPAAAPRPARDDAYLIVATEDPTLGLSVYGDEARMPFLTPALAEECARRLFPPEAFPDTHWWVVAVCDHADRFPDAPDRPPD